MRSHISWWHPELMLAPANYNYSPIPTKDLRVPEKVSNHMQSPEDHLCQAWRSFHNRASFLLIALEIFCLKLTQWGWSCCIVAIHLKPFFYFMRSLKCSYLCGINISNIEHWMWGPEMHYNELGSVDSWWESNKAQLTLIILQSQRWSHTRGHVHEIILRDSVGTINKSAHSDPNNCHTHTHTHSGGHVEWHHRLVAVI